MCKKCLANNPNYSRPNSLLALTHKNGAGKKGKEAYAWKGDKATYAAKHRWLYNNYGKAGRCESSVCESKSLSYDWANVSGLYLRDRKDYKMLCKPCHRKFDNPLGLNEKLEKPVSMYTIDGSFIRKFKSVTSVAKYLNCHTTNISQVLHGRARQSHGYHFQFIDKKRQ